MKKALILDLDNTIYPVSAIADELFSKLFDMVDEFREMLNDPASKDIKYDFTQQPYQHVAEKYHFSAELTEKGLQHLQNLTYDKPIKPYNGYNEIKALAVEKYLVTSGFSKLQQSKIEMLGIANDFREIYIVDQQLASRTKKDVFTGFISNYGYKPDDILVIGDDPHSEIKAAIELGIDTFLYDPLNKYPATKVTYRSSNLADVCNAIG